MSANIIIERFTEHHPRWDAYITHLQRVKIAEYVIDEHREPLPQVYCLGIAERVGVVGHISLKMQPIIVPAVAGSENHETTLTDMHGHLLQEMFVRTFAVDEEHRREGHGSALQKAALDLAKALRCYQLRSFSPLQSEANYALKIKLGFAIHPGIFTQPDGEQIRGVYFVRSVE